MLVLGSRGKPEEKPIKKQFVTHKSSGLSAPGTDSKIYQKWVNRVPMSCVQCAGVAKCSVSKVMK